MSHTGLMRQALVVSLGLLGAIAVVAVLCFWLPGFLEAEQMQRIAQGRLGWRKHAGLPDLLRFSGILLGFGVAWQTISVAQRTP